MGSFIVYEKNDQIFLKKWSFFDGVMVWDGGTGSVINSVSTPLYL